MYLNDFDLSASSVDPGNKGWIQGTPEFASIWLDNDHTFDQNDDYCSLLLSYISCFLADAVRVEDRQDQLQQLAEGTMPLFAPEAVTLARRILEVQRAPKRRKVKVEETEPTS